MAGTLGGYNAAFADDDGAADPATRRALQAAVDGGQEAYLDAVAAVCTSRLLMPLVAGGDDTMTADPERAGHMSTALLQRADGQRAVLAFTGADALNLWFPKARPVPATLDVVCQTAQQEGADTVLIDLEGPSPLVIEGEVLAHLALSRRLTRLPDGAFGWVVAGGQGEAD